MQLEQQYQQRIAMAGGSGPRGPLGAAAMFQGAPGAAPPLFYPPGPRGPMGPGNPMMNPYLMGPGRGVPGRGAPRAMMPQVRAAKQLPSGCHCTC